MLFIVWNCNGWSAGRLVGWSAGRLVGWVERPDAEPVVYALFVDGPDWASVSRFRREASVSLLRQAGIWPED